MDTKQAQAVDRPARLDPYLTPNPDDVLEIFSDCQGERGVAFEHAWQHVKGCELCRPEFVGLVELKQKFGLVGQST